MSSFRPVVTDEEVCYFRNQLRAGRADALRDAEGSHEILYAIERLGVYCHGKVATLHSYKGSIGKVAGASALAHDVPKEWKQCHICFDVLYDEMTAARNEALHQGAYARVLTSHAIQVAIILEDALMNNAKTVAQFMVHNPVTAKVWQPVSFVRQQMLTNSYSYLPLQSKHEGSLQWYLVSEVAIARFLRSAPTERDRRLATKLGEAIIPNQVQVHVRVVKAKTVRPDAAVEKALKKMVNGPVLVVNSEDPPRLVGIVTAYDLL